MLALTSPALGQTGTTPIQTDNTTEETQQTENAEEADTLEDTESDEVEISDVAGLTPDQFFYPLERLIESVQVSLTFSGDGKAELLIEFANERLAEAEIMTEANKQELVERVMEDYLQTINSANKNLEKAIESDEDVESIIDQIITVEANADKVLIKITGVVNEDVAKELKQKVESEVKKTLAVQSFAAAKENFFDAKKLFEAAKDEYKNALETGDEAAIKAAFLKLEAAEVNKDQMEQIKDEVEEAKEEIKEELEKAKEELEKQEEKAKEELEKQEEKAKKEREKLEDKDDEEATEQQQ